MSQDNNKYYLFCTLTKLFLSEDMFSGTKLKKYAAISSIKELNNWARQYKSIDNWLSDNPQWKLLTEDELLIQEIIE